MIDIYTLALSYYAMSKSDAVALIELFGSAEIFLTSNRETMINRYGVSERLADKIIAKRDENIAKAKENSALLDDFGVKCLTYGSAKYPPMLASCSDAPLALYLLGDDNFNNDNSKWFSVTGTKSVSDCGRLITSKLIEDIAKHDKGITLVSGVSDGIEKQIHREAVQLGIKSVAVIPYALDKVQSEMVRKVMSDVLNRGGTVVSEYPMGTNFFSSHYKECNRIIAGLSHATILVEAPHDSNTLTTIGYADSYSRDVFAFPGRVIDTCYAGCNAAIKSGKAEMITSFTDIIVSMELTSNFQKAAEDKAITLDGDMGKIYELLGDGTPHSDEEIMMYCDIAPHTFNSLISLMELDDLVVALRGRMYVRKL